MPPLTASGSIPLHAERPELRALWRPLGEATLATIPQPPSRSSLLDAEGLRSDPDNAWANEVVGRRLNWAHVLGVAHGRGFSDEECRLASEWLGIALGRNEASNKARCLGAAWPVRSTPSNDLVAHVVETAHSILFCYSNSDPDKPDRWFVRPLDPQCGRSIEAHALRLTEQLGFPAIAEYNPSQASPAELADLASFFRGLAVALACESEDALRALASWVPALGGLAAEASGRAKAMEESAALSAELLASGNRPSPTPAGDPAPDSASARRV